MTSCECAAMVTVCVWVEDSVCVAVVTFDPRLGATKFRPPSMNSALVPPTAVLLTTIPCV